MAAVPRSHSRTLMMFFLRYWLPLIFWMVVIFSASGDVKSVQHTDGIIATVLRWLHIQVTPQQLETLRWIARKGAHATEFAVLAMLWWRALRGRNELQWAARPAVIALLACILYAASDEFHQSFVKDRTPLVSDVCIDTAGALGGLAVIWLIIWRRQRKQPA